jgi:hypothetical protein
MKTKQIPFAIAALCISATAPMRAQAQDLSGLLSAESLAQLSKLETVAENEATEYDKAHPGLDVPELLIISGRKCREHNVSPQAARAYRSCFVTSYLVLEMDKGGGDFWHY